MNNVSYFRLVKETLTENWSKYAQPLRVNNGDLKVGMRLLTKIAVEAIDGEYSIKASESTSRNTPHEVSSEIGSSNQTVDKIKAFVQEKAYIFRRVCQRGFPFSLLESASTEVALKHALECDDPILSHFMMLEGNWLTEHELNERFGVPFQRLQTEEIAEACSNLKLDYVRNGNNKAGYYLLWLIKQAAGCDYEMPEKVFFNKATVTGVLDLFFGSSRSLTHPANFVEILHYRSDRLDASLSQEFLHPKCYLIFLNFAIKQLRKIPMEKWPNKAGIITDLFETLTRKDKLSAAKILVLSKDYITSEIGNHLFAALTAISIREAIPHFNSLVALLPNINDSHIEIIFGCPFIEFCCDKSIYRTDPKFTRRLNFNDMRKVFVHDSLMIGVYDTQITRGGKKVPAHLLAYDMNTEKMVWGIPLTPVLNSGVPRMGPADYSLNRMGQHLSLQFVGEKNMRFIDPETGEFNFTLELPEASKDAYDRLHISSEGFAYQMVHKGRERILIGGKVVDQQWNSSFESNTPTGFFRPFSTHCGFQDDFPEKLILFGPTGDQMVIQNCMAAIAQNDKLYAIEKHPDQEEKCLLTIRTLKIDDEVVSDVEKSISLNVRKASFGSICQNGQLVLFSGAFSDSSPIFVDLNGQEVMYSQHKSPSYAKHVINTDTGELWTWDELSKDIWKVSSANITLMGSMESGRGTTLLHVDKADRLYFVDIPF